MGRHVKRQQQKKGEVECPNRENHMIMSLKEN